MTKTRLKIATLIALGITAAFGAITFICGFIYRIAIDVWAKRFWSNPFERALELWAWIVHSKGRDNHVQERIC
jgi:hypothetical protein